MNKHWPFRSLLRVWISVSAIIAAAPAAAQTDPVLISLGRSNIEHHSGWIEFAEGMASQADLPAASREYYRQIANRHERLRVLNQEVVAALEAESAAPLDPKANAVSGPLKDYLERQEALARDPKATAVSGPLQDYLERVEAQRRQADAASAVLDSAGEGGRAGQLFGTSRAREAGARIADGRNFTRVIVNSSGETIVNDRVDVLEAKLEDLSRRQEELERSTRSATGLREQRSIRAQLIALDREIFAAMNELSRLLIQRRVKAAKVCKPNSTKIMVTGCEFWGRKLPVVIPQGHGVPISLDHAQLEITEDQGQLVGWRMNIWYRNQTEAALRRTDQPTRSENGELRANSDGTYSMLVTSTDEQGDERTQVIPLQLDRWVAAAAGVDFIDQKHPLQLRFDRDMDNFVLLDGSRVSAQEAQRILGHDGLKDLPSNAELDAAARPAGRRAPRGLQDRGGVAPPSSRPIAQTAPARPTPSIPSAPKQRPTDPIAEGIRSSVEDGLKDAARKLLPKLPF